MDMGLLVRLFKNNSGSRPFYQHRCRDRLLPGGGPSYIESGNGNAHKDFFKTKMTRMEKIGLYLAMGGAVILLFMFFFSTRGVMDYSRLKYRQEQLDSRAAIAGSQNSKMEKEVLKLKTDIEYIKHLAKHEHEMAAQDELVFKEKPKKQGSEK